jgi:DNA gyrase inhibitor GyrI
MASTRYQLQQLKICKGCQHHVSNHQYVPKDDRKPTVPRKCRVPDCTCTEFQRKVNAYEVQ